MVETFAISPIASLNYEYLPVRWRTSFVSLRAGAGYVPGGAESDNSKVSNSGGISFPTSATYNFLFNNLRKRVFNRVYKRCKSAPSKIASELFGEVGAGYTFVAYRTTETRNFGFGIIGLRQQIVFDIPPHPRVIYIRANVTPSYADGVYELRGGISLGVSL